MIGETPRAIIIYVVTTIWALNFLAPFVFPTYQPTESINAIFMAIVGGAFILRPKKNGNGNGNGSS